MPREKKPKQPCGIDSGTIAEIYSKYLTFMLAVSGTVIENKAFIEDAVHNAMLYIIESRNKLRIDTENENQLMSFLRIIVQHKALDMMKHESKLNIMELSEIDDKLQSSDQPEASAGLNERCDLAMRYLDEMSEDAKDIFSLLINTDLSEKEIAQLLGMSEDNVYQIISRTRKRLHRMLGDE